MRSPSISTLSLGRGLNLRVHRPPRFDRELKSDLQAHRTFPLFKTLLGPAGFTVLSRKAQDPINLRHVQNS